MTKIETPGSLKISWANFCENDMWVYSTLAVLLVLVGLFIFLQYSGYGFVRRTTGAFVGKSASRYYGYAAFAAIPVLLWVLYWRYSRVKAIMQDSILIRGKIIGVSAFDYCSDLVNVEYEYNDKKYRHSKIIVFGHTTLRVEGNVAEMVAKKENPDRSLIKDLFFCSNEKCSYTAFSGLR